MPRFESDLYSVGLVICEMLDGRSPYDELGSHDAAIAQLRFEAPPYGPRTRSSRLFPVVERLSEKRFWLRYASARDALEALRAVAGDLLSQARGEPPIDLAIAPDRQAPDPRLPGGREITAPMRRPARTTDEPSTRVQRSSHRMRRVQTGAASFVQAIEQELAARLFEQKVRVVPPSEN